VSVCPCAKYLKGLWTDFDEVSGGAGRGPRNSKLDFGSSPDHDPTVIRVREFFRNDYLLLHFLYVKHDLSFYWHTERIQAYLQLKYLLTLHIWIEHENYRGLSSKQTAF